MSAIQGGFLAAAIGPGMRRAGSGLRPLTARGARAWLGKRPRLFFFLISRPNKESPNFSRTTGILFIYTSRNPPRRSQAISCQKFVLKASLCNNVLTLFARFENAKRENQKGSWLAVQNVPVHG